MNGKVTLSGSGETIIGATVVAVHEPSGTRYATASNADGRYNIQGMRTGGPYTVTVSYVGHQTKAIKEVTLQLGEVYNLDIALSEDATQLSEVVVSAVASKFAAEKTGASTNISQQQILNMPTANRNIEDLARLSPYANGMGFAGGDGRSTNFTLDGANLNNNFGLSSNLPGGGTPVSMDALDEIQVVVSPFDVRQSNFIGGGINAVTKSGTNTFKGTAYIYHTNENMHGNRIDNTDLSERGKVRNSTYGFTLGGPIIKDKLFFFANAEYSKVPSVANRWRASVDGVADSKNYISRTTTADMQRVHDFLLSTYGYDTGSYTSFPADEDNLKLLGRIDWNINDDHHLAVRYNYTKNTAWNSVNGNSSDTGYRLRGLDRMSQYSMSFANSMYKMDNKVSTISADLHSRFGEQFANQLLFTYTNIEDVRGSNSSLFPFVDIMAGYTTAVDGTVTQTLQPYMSFGYELFTYNNKVENKITTVTDNFTWYAGAHKVTAGFNFEHQLANNSYMRNGTGYYRYRSLDDFLNGAVPETVGLTYGYNGAKAPNAQVRFNQYGLYLQDEWNVMDHLKLTGGIRFDNISFDNSDILRNNAIYALDFGGRHIDTGSWPNTNIQISPRLGFSWDVFGDKSLKVRGGTGLFAGRLPLVFFTNMPTNSGMVQNLVHADTQYKSGVVSNTDSRLANFAGGLITDTERIRELLGVPATITPDEGAVQKNIAGIDNDFKMPQVWKTSIGVDYVVPVSFPFTLTGEFTYTKNVNAVVLENYNIKNADAANWARLSGADNRMIYPSHSEKGSDGKMVTLSDYVYYRDITDANVLKNTSKGHGWTFNLTANMTPVKNLDLMASYTHTVMKEISGMPGNNASSTWSGNLTVDGPNFGTVHNSQYVIPDRFIASATYTFNKYDHFTLFYQGYQPATYESGTFYYNGDINGDNIGYDLMYIPANDQEISFTNEADRQLFWNFVNQDNYLKHHKGEYAEAYSARAPFVHRFDFRWAHDFCFKTGNLGHKLQLSIDLMNLGNLLSSKWGVEKTMSSCFNGQVLKVDKVVDGVPSFSMNRTLDANKQPIADTYSKKTWEFNHNYNQCWKLQIGLKYYFN